MPRWGITNRRKSPLAPLSKGGLGGFLSVLVKLKHRLLTECEHSL